MKKKNSTRRSLVSSVISLVLCVAMLVGATFAWFTDSVTSGKNKIVAGNLDIKLEYKNDTQTTYADVTANTNVFKDSALWEPGHVEYAVLKISNAGTLALKYNLGIGIDSETAGTNVSGDSFKLSSYLKYAVLDDDQSALTRDAMVSAAESSAQALGTYTTNGNMTAGADAKEMTLVVWMPTTVGNEANYKTGTTVPEITMGINLVATQYTSESDSFNNKYDLAAPWTGGYDDDGLTANTNADAKTVKIESAEQLASFAKAVNGGNSYAGYTITLEKDIDLNNVAWTPIGTSAHAFNGIFDGQNHTILNLKATGTEYVGLFGNVNGTIKNVSIKNATITGVTYVGTVVGKLYGSVTGCSVTNATITANENADYKYGEKAGGIVGFMGEGGTSAKDNTVTNVTINGFNALGGVVGCYYGNNTITGNTVTGLTINEKYTASHAYRSYTKQQFGAIYGMDGGGYTGGDLQTNTGDATINKVTVVTAAATAEQTTSAVKTAINNASSGDTVVLPETTQTIDLSNTTLNASGATVVGNDTTTVKVSTGGDSPSVNADGVVFDGVTFDYGNGTYNAIRGTVTYKNCTFNGLVNSYDNSTFTNCTFTNTGDNYCAHVYGGTATFTGCTFNGDVKCVYVYSDGSDATASFSNCSFNFSLVTSEGTPDKSAVMLNASNGNGAYTVTITNCTAVGANTTAAANDAGNTNYQGIYGLKHKDGNGNPALVKGTVTVDDTTVYNQA